MGAPARPPKRAKAPDQAVLVGLVENDTALRNSISLTIETMGSDVLPCPTGEEALALFDELGVAPDCFLLDNQLGDGMTGVELVGVLRERYGTLPITIISADRSPDLATQCRDLGVPLRHKPLSKADIVATLRDARANA